jgi:hypothetical protein
MNKLITMTDFVLLMRESEDKDNIRRFWACERYAKFLKQPLELWMFIPCDKEGNALEYPAYYNEIETVVFSREKECCLFEFDKAFLLFSKIDLENQTVEDLLSDDYGYILTPAATKQIYG